jgi:hypothetical protein
MGTYFVPQPFQLIFLSLQRRGGAGREAVGLSVCLIRQALTLTLRGPLPLPYRERGSEWEN